MKIASVPRHLTKEQRKGALKDAAALLVSGAEAEAALTLGVSVEKMRASLGAAEVAKAQTIAEMHVAIGWLVERVDQLETELSAGHQRLKELEAVREQG